MDTIEQASVDLVRRLATCALTDDPYTDDCIVTAQSIQDRLTARAKAKARRLAQTTSGGMTNGKRL